jgi:hypothetical protein
MKTPRDYNVIGMIKDSAVIQAAEYLPVPSGYAGAGGRLSAIRHTIIPRPS